MAIKINNNSYSGFFLNGEAINTIYLNGNQVFGNGGSEPTPTPAWDDDFLTIEALNASTTVQLRNPLNKNIWYRKDNETEYTKIPTGNTSITIENANGYIKLYGDNEGVGAASNSTFTIYCEMNCNCYGKVTSLLSSGCPETISSTYTFKRLFRQSKIVDARGLILPNNVTDFCYNAMFNGCTSLVNPPSILPATTLEDSCYASMFNRCSSLTQAPQLPATTLAERCYYAMFGGCSSLTQAPQLPATTLAERCYNGMFSGCSSLTQAPQLPATTLENSCYASMFNLCSSLTQAPQLPATTLEGSCYEKMFYGCQNLSTVTLCYADAAPTANSYSFSSWLEYTGGTGGTIYAPADALWDSSDSEMYIPSNWTVEKIL